MTIINSLPLPGASLPWGRKPQWPSDREGPQITGTAWTENSNSSCGSVFTTKLKTFTFQGPIRAEAPSETLEGTHTMDSWIHLSL